MTTKGTKQRKRLHPYLFHDLTISLIFHGDILAIEQYPHDSEEESVESKEVVCRNSEWN